ncbi:MAG: hypothetical protein GF421_10735 [Candidatus Aminicenantes bacterium]|nr:hypothetical protein [Candidatus Aminicenantes bacterium]
MRNKCIRMKAVFLVVLIWGGNLHSQTDFERGTVISKVLCQHFPSHSYALYLPQEYTPEKSWPILYALDPSARGYVPVEHFKEAAKKHGFLVVGSNNFRNGPWEDIFQAVQIMWDDTQSRFSIDSNSIYVTGFSGGARAAVLFSQAANHPVTGVIGCGAGLPSQFNPEEINPSIYYGAVGFADFNYREMIMLDIRLNQAKVTHHIHYFEGTHAWPPSDVCLSAWEWMEIMRMKQYIVPEDREKTERIYAKKRQRAQDLEEQGKIYWAVLRYQTISSLFRGLKDTSEIKEKINLLQQRDEYKQFAQRENERIQRETEIVSICGSVFNRIEQSPQDCIDFEALFAKMKLESLQEEAQAQNQVEEQSLAVRLLHLIFNRAVQTGNQHLKNNHPLKAVVLFQIASKASEGNESVHKRVLFDLAQAYALNSDKQTAVHYLELAVKKGFNDASAVQNSPYFEGLRESQPYQNVLEQIKKKVSSHEDGDKL